MYRNRILTLAFLLTSLTVVGAVDYQYLNYARAIRNYSNFGHFLVVKIKDPISGKTREVCTKSNFLRGALHTEHGYDYDTKSSNKVEKLALENRARYFVFKKKYALNNIFWNRYSESEIKQLEAATDFLSLAKQIRASKQWSKRFKNDKSMHLYAHCLFNRGILTGESDCFGGTLQYVPEERK